MKKLFLFTVMTISAYFVSAQTVTLEECQSAAQQHFPLAKQQGLIEQMAKNTAAALLSQYFPQIQINGQATYQSDVTKLALNLPQGFPALDIPAPDKDQYKIYADVSQTVFDGGVIASQRKLAAANSRVETEKVAVEMYKLKDRVNQTYFGILLMDEQLKQTDLLHADLQTALDKVNVMVENGVSLVSNRQRLEAEMLNVKQAREEILTSRKSLIEVLSLLTGKEMAENTAFAKPDAQLTPKTRRPELSLIDYQLNTVKLQNQQLTAQNLPKLNLFLQGGYGKPALNMFKNDFESYYVAGVRLTWQLSRLYTLGKERNNLKVQEKSLEIQRDLFSLNQKITETQQNSEIRKLRDKLKSDDEIIALRGEIKKTSQVQLENGVMTASDFIRDANAENQARQTKALHEMQLLLAEHNLRWIAP